MKYRCGHVTKSTLLSAHNCSPLKNCIMDMFPLIFTMCIFCPAVICMCSTKSLGFCCASILELERLNFLRECACFMLGMRILAKNTAPKCSPHDGLLLHQIQQLFPCIAVFCSAVLCQFSLFSLRRMHTGELIHQPSEELCSN